MDTNGMTPGQKAALAAEERSSLDKQNAARLGIGEGSIRRARRIKRHLPDKFEMVASGAMTISAVFRDMGWPLGKENKGSVKPMSKKADIIRIRNAGKNAAKPAPRLVYDRNDEVAEQVCTLCHRLREVADKTPPELLYKRFNARLKRNLDMSLPQAIEFLSALADAHSGAAAEEEDAAS